MNKTQNYKVKQESKHKSQVRESERLMIIEMTQPNTNLAYAKNL